MTDTTLSADAAERLAVTLADLRAAATFAFEVIVFTASMFVLGAFILFVG